MLSPKKQKKPRRDNSSPCTTTMTSPSAYFICICHQSQQKCKVCAPDRSKSRGLSSNSNTSNTASNAPAQFQSQSLSQPTKHSITSPTTTSGTPPALLILTEIQHVALPDPEANRLDSLTFPFKLGHININRLTTLSHFTLSP